jgi:uncharacterized membrane protein YeaQ/YmgE (transglycosylase-associated protein family)
MRTVVAILVALVVGAIAWIVASLLLNLLDLARGETGWLQRLFVEFLAPGIGAFIGLQVAHKVAKQYSLDGLFFGFSAAVVAATIVIAVYMQAVAAKADWSAHEWLVMILTPLGAVVGASVARATLRPGQ